MQRRLHVRERHPFPELLPHAADAEIPAQRIVTGVVLDRVSPGELTGILEFPLLDQAESFGEFAGLLDLEDNTNLYYLCFAALLATIYLVRRIVNSRFGMVIKGTKGNEARMQSLGFDTYRYQLACYVIAGAICGLAGALLGNFTNFISPEMMDWTRSGELIFMVVLGGTATLSGPLLGATLFLLLEEYLPHGMDLFLKGSGVYWQLVFGIILILMVLFIKGGLHGFLTRGRRDG